MKIKNHKIETINISNSYIYGLNMAYRFADSVMQENIGPNDKLKSCTIGPIDRMFLLSCIICWDYCNKLHILPCGHMGLCGECLDMMATIAKPCCPLCRKPLLF